MKPEAPKKEDKSGGGWWSKIGAALKMAASVALSASVGPAMAMGIKGAMSIGSAATNKIGQKKEQTPQQALTKSLQSRGINEYQAPVTKFDATAPGPTGQVGTDPRTSLIERQISKTESLIETLKSSSLVGTRRSQNRIKSLEETLRQQNAQKTQQMAGDFSTRNAQNKTSADLNAMGGSKGGAGYQPQKQIDKLAQVFSEYNTNTAKHGRLMGGDLVKSKNTWEGNVRQGQVRGAEMTSGNPTEALANQRLKLARSEQLLERDLGPKGNSDPEVRAEIIHMRKDNIEITKQQILILETINENLGIANGQRKQQGYVRTNPSKTVGIVD